MKKVLFLLIPIILIFIGCAEESKPVKTQRPNIIFLLTDDQRWDALGAMGNPIIQTPNLDALANEGFHFKNAYVTTSICSVSRASLLTGQYLSRHGIDDFETGLSAEALNQTYPILLNQNGYRIGFLGKYGVGDVKWHPDELFDYWSCTEKSQPDYENTDENGNYLHYTDLLNNEINRFLDTGDERPFCLSVSFKAPHVQDEDVRQFIPNPRYNELYSELTIPKPKTADPAYWESFPDFFRTDENIARERWKQRFDTEEKFQESVKNYYRLITGVDDVIGDLKRRLKEENLADNTIIVFMGDNGMFLGERGLAGKWYPYEESIRVPLIIYDPRVEAPKGKLDAIALNVDIAPTILALADVAIPSQMQGQDLFTTITNDSLARESFYYEHTFFGSPKIPISEALVNPETKYIIYPEHNYEELYDLTKDPLEEINLVGNPDYLELLKSQRDEFKVVKQIANYNGTKEVVTGH